MSESGSSIEEITRMEEHLNDTMLKIFDDNHFDDANINTQPDYNEEYEFRKKNREKNSETLVHINSQTPYSYQTPYLTSTNFSHSNSMLTRGGLSSIINSNSNLQILPQYLDSSNTIPNFRYNQFHQHYSNNSASSFRFNSNNSGIPNYHNTQMSSGPINDYTYYDQSQRIFTSSDFNKSSNEFCHNSGFLHQVVRIPMSLTKLMPLYSSDKHIETKLTNISKPQSIPESFSKCSSHNQIAQAKKVSSLKINYDKLTIDEIITLIPVISKEQQGCRFLQGKVEKSLKFAENVIVPNIQIYFEGLMTDKFGNYLIQKLIDKLSSSSMVPIKKAVSKL